MYLFHYPQALRLIPRQAMAKNLVEKGNLSRPLILYNRTTKRATDLSTKIGHSTVAESISSTVSDADIIFYCLGDDKAVLDTVSEIIKTNITGKLIVDCSTIHPDTTTKEAFMIHEAGGHFVAAPVMGAPAVAEAGQLVFLLAGTAEAIDRVKPHTTGVMGRADIDLSGLEPRSASVMKLIGNTFILSMINTLSEGHVMAEKTGLGVENMQKWIETIFPAIYPAYSTRMITGDYYKREEPLFGVDLALKDMGHARNVAGEAGLRMRNVELAEEYLRVVKEVKGTKGDLTGIYGAKRMESGLSFDN